MAKDDNNRFLQEKIAKNEEYITLLKKKRKQTNEKLFDHKIKIIIYY